MVVGTPGGGEGNTWGHNLLEARTPLVQLVIGPRGKESWSLGSVCSFDLQGALLGQQKQNLHHRHGDQSLKKKQSLVSWLQAGTWQVASHSQAHSGAGRDWLSELPGSVSEEWEEAGKCETRMALS